MDIVVRWAMQGLCSSRERLMRLMLHERASHLFLKLSHLALAVTLALQREAQEKRRSGERVEKKRAE